MRAAVAGDYGIEVDLQISADGEAMVHHDAVLGRLTEGEGRLDRLTAAELKCVAFRDSDERMMTLGELCDLVGGRVTMLLELKSRFDGDARLPARVAAVLGGYGGPVAPMSFDPLQLATCCGKGPLVCRAALSRRNIGRTLLGSDAGMAALRHGLPAPSSLDGAAAIRGLCGRRSAGIRAVVRAARFVPAAADVGGAYRERATARRALCRPDIFEGFGHDDRHDESRRQPAGNENPARRARRRRSLRIVAVNAIAEVERRGVGCLRQSTLVPGL